jgi:hypothetical protein
LKEGKEMGMHKKVQSLVLAGIVSANALTPVAEVFADNKETNTKESRVIKASNSQEQVYLSDISWTGASAGWGEVRKDTNVEGNDMIKLIVDGEVVGFTKGMAAHAPSTLLYAVSRYSDEYTRLVSYVGVDASRENNGNGVKFQVLTSNNGNTWTKVHETKVLKGNTESEYIDVNIKGAKFVKLVADMNGNNAADHAVYGDLKLVKEDYKQTSNEVVGLETVEHYDNILKSNSVEHNIANNEEIILKRAFVKRMGYATLKNLANQNNSYAEAINYLLSNPTALKYYMMGGQVSKQGSYQRTLKAFCDIYDKYKEDFNDKSYNDFNLRLAISVSLAFANQWMVRFWIVSETESNAANRYAIYKELSKSGGVMDQAGNTNNHAKWSSAEFKNLPIALMKWAVSNKMNDDEILWLADFGLKEKAEGDNFVDAYNYISYTDGYNYDNPRLFDKANEATFNQKYGNFNNYLDARYKYGTKKVYRLWQIFEEGSVCGGLAKTYSNLATTFGRPSNTVGQPGHAATITYEWNKNNNRYEWVIQNDISGWSQSGNEYEERMLGWGNQSWSIWHSASYAVLATDCVLDRENFSKAMMLNLLAESYTDNRKQECYEKALEVQPKNLDAMEGLVNCYKADNTKTSADFLALARKVIDAYTYYPQAMMELLSVFEANITDSNDMVQLDILKNNALLKAKSATPNESSCVQMSKQMAEKYLNNGEVSELATFSFDGENAGKIVLNSKYEGSSIRLEYSLDGGNNWIETDQHTIELTPDQIASITADNDIKVSLVGTTDVHVIDILEGKTVSGLYANDLENLLIGSEQNLSNLEFSTDNGNTWCNYIGGLENGIRIEGNTTVKARYKAYGTYLQGKEATYTFTNDTNTKDRSYVQLKNVKLETYSTQQSDGVNHAAKNFIDGDFNSAWHTRYNYVDPSKHYTVSFDKERYITSLEYTPTGRNGRIKSADIYTSIDGITWTKSGSAVNLADNTAVKSMDLDNPTKCKYLTLVVTETYGNNPSERNMYVSGKMLNFFEAIKEEEIPGDDFDNGMNVNPDEDMMVDIDKTPSKPNYDVDDNMGIEQEGADIPTTLPDDVPVEEVVQDIEVENKVDKTHVLKVNTKQGLDRVLEWLGTNMSYDREVDAVVDEDTNTTTYKLNVFHHDMTVSYVNIKVSSDDKELIDILDAIKTVLPPIEGEMPEDDNLDSDMEVNPDNDQVVENTPVILPDDVPVDTTDTPATLPDDVPVEGVKPEDNIDTDMGVDTDKIPSKPNYDVEDNMGVITPSKPNYEVDDDMMIDQEGADIPVTLPDDIPVEDMEIEQETPSFTHDVVELVNGNGQENTPYELVVKEVEVEKFNGFLEELKVVNTVVVSVTEEENHTVYKVKFNKVTRSANGYDYAIIKVEKSKTDLVDTFNNFATETNPDIVIPNNTTPPATPEKPEVDLEDKFEPVLDGTGNDDMMVTPNVEVRPDVNKPNVEEVLKPNVNNESNTITNNSTNDNPKTGDVGIAAYAGLGLASLLGVLNIKRKRK